MPRTLRDLAHTRAGDKGDISCISVIALRPDRAEDFALLEQHVTAERVRAHFAELVHGEVPQLGALNFVLHGALAGGVTRSLALDAHGKSLSSALLTLEIPG